MTTPQDRTRHLVQAGAFLIELADNAGLPMDIRAEAHRLLRHYPTVSEIRMMAQLENNTAIFKVPLIADAFEREWVDRYTRGAHR
ncbi:MULTISPECIES: BPSL0761 family protein [Stenotrophomonas]|jgi:hypothetical protein|uniref:BPSL0761 family protein n=1 Tax=Stenotrophomonas TaxID=40323 RepID=UPI001009EAC9|nr:MULTISPECIES: BPSL0761 family protein [Stenotrophomonas]MBA0222800.1 hypothetical protein [Stenotrophomonas maltophilia]MBH1594273.1 hypothetical protein [Stenotrophomonas maltophilia]MDH0173472.1 hypothetical protein [Stenotrophomonas sp. GD04145]MDH2023053.1 hypothetical protein [Stenotrophomonas sp. GD03680]MDI9247464.1 BPSL0761 family protein [Stenotrophomonas sp. RS-48]